MLGRGGHFLWCSVKPARLPAAGYAGRCSCKARGGRQGRSHEILVLWCPQFFFRSQLCGFSHESSESQKLQLLGINKDSSC